jgi:hypothetical protein
MLKKEQISQKEYYQDFDNPTEIRKISIKNGVDL